MYLILEWHNINTDRYPPLHEHQAHHNLDQYTEEHQLQPHRPSLCIQLPIFNAHTTGLDSQLTTYWYRRQWKWIFLQAPESTAGGAKNDSYR